MVICQELRNDKDIVKAAVYDKADAIKFATDEKKSDREVALTALQVVNEGCAFAIRFFLPCRATPTGRALAAVGLTLLDSQSQEGVGKVLGLVNPVLREDREVVMEAVKVAGKLDSYLSCVKSIFNA